MKIADKVDPLEAARLAIAQDKAERIDRFQQGLEELMERERVKVGVRVTLNGMTLVPHLEITALD